MRARANACSQLSETIVEVLRSMRCPFPLQANQIQGNDFNALFPVIQWLVRKVLETRELMGDVSRKFSELLFAAAYVVEEEQGAAASPALIQSVSTRYRPVRRLRRSQALWTETLGEDARVQSCLLEYGEKAGTLAGMRPLLLYAPFATCWRSSAARSAAEQASSQGSAGTAAGAAAGDEDGDGTAAAAAAAAGARRGSTLSTLSAFERQFAAAQKAAEKEREQRAEEAARREEVMLREMASGARLCGCQCTRSLARTSVRSFREHCSPRRWLRSGGGGRTAVWLGGGQDCGPAVGRDPRRLCRLRLCCRRAPPP